MENKQPRSNPRQEKKRDVVILKGLLAGRYENRFVTENLLFSIDRESLECRRKAEKAFNMRSRNLQ